MLMLNVHFGCYPILWHTEYFQQEKNETEKHQRKILKQTIEWEKIVKQPV